MDPPRTLSEPADERPHKRARVDIWRTPQASGISLVDEGCLVGDSYGSIKFKVYKAWSHKAQMERPIVALWLHGGAMKDPDHKDLCQVQARLRRRVIFVVPLNPKPIGELKF